MQQGVLPAGAVRGGREAAVVVQGVLGGDSRVWDGKGWGRSGAPGWGSGRSGWGHTVGSPRRPILSPAAAAAKHEAGADLRVAAPMSGDTGAPGSAQPHRGADPEPQRNAAPRPPPQQREGTRRAGGAGPEVRIGAGGGQNEAGAQRDRDVRGGTGEGGGGLEGGAAKRKTRGSGPQKTPPKKKGGMGGDGAEIRGEAPTRRQQRCPHSAAQRRCAPALGGETPRQRDAAAERGGGEAAV